jgi:hypothetical protein
MRPINQEEAEEMRSALKKIASFYNPAQERDGGQMAALTARETLEKVGLLFQEDAYGPPKPGSSDSSRD